MATVMPMTSYSHETCMSCVTCDVIISTEAPAGVSDEGSRFIVTQIDSKYSQWRQPIDE